MVLPLCFSETSHTPTASFWRKRTSIWSRRQQLRQRGRNHPSHIIGSIVGSAADSADPPAHLPVPPPEAAVVAVVVALALPWEQQQDVQRPWEHESGSSEDPLVAKRKGGSLDLFLLLRRDEKNTFKEAQRRRRPVSSCREEEEVWRRSACKGKKNSLKEVL